MFVNIFKIHMFVGSLSDKLYGSLKDSRSNDHYLNQIHSSTINEISGPFMIEIEEEKLVSNHQIRITFKAIRVFFYGKHYSIIGKAILRIFGL